MPEQRNRETVDPVTLVEQDDGSFAVIRSGGTGGAFSDESSAATAGWDRFRDALNRLGPDYGPPLIVFTVRDVVQKSTVMYLCPRCMNQGEIP